MAPQSFVGMIWEIVRDRMPFLDPSGAAPVTTKDNGIVCVENSTNTPLGIGGVFTGEWQDTLNYNVVVVGAVANQSSAVDGLVVDWSADGVTSTQTDEFTISANKGKVFTFTPPNRYVRLSYTNGALAQASFDLQVIFKKGGFKASSHRVGDDIVEEDDAELVKSVITYLTNEDTFTNIDVQHPLPNDGDSVYVKDLDISNSDSVNFSGSVTDYFDSLKTVNSDATANNPKSIKLWFNRTIYSSSIGFGCDDLLKSFSNIKINFLGSGEAIRGSVDLSTDDTKRNSFLVEFEPLAFNGLLIEFHTTDEVCLSNLTIPKETQVAARIKAKKENGQVVDIGATNNDNLKVSVQEYGDTPSVDAFARLRVSDNFTIFDSKQLHDKQPLFWDELLGGGATSVHSSADASVVIAVTASASDYAIRQTKQRFNYQPGKSQLIFFTFLCECVPGLTKRMGYFSGDEASPLDPENGIFFETSNNELKWNIAKDGSITETVSQDNWNVDKLDGTGASGITLNMDATQIAIVDFEWLGVGRVRAGFVIDGLIYYTHNFNHANNDSFNSVYMSTPNLPLRYSIESDGSVAGSLTHICSSVISEGGIEKTGILRSVENSPGFVPSYALGTKYALVAIRLKDAYHDISVIPEAIAIVIGTNDSFKWELHLNPAINGTFTYSDLNDSSVQFAQGVVSNTVPTDGVIISRGGASTVTRASEAELKTALRIGSTIAGVRDELVLVFQPFTNNTSVWADLNFRELL